MRLCLRSLSVLAFSGLLAGAAATPAAAQPPRFRVTITNLTPGQSFTPFVIATHTSAVRIFEPGTMATSQLRDLAEDGATGPLVTMLAGNPSVRHVVTGAGLLMPGATASYEVIGGVARLSLVSMLIPTNDAFVGVQGVALPYDTNAVVVDAVAYDAGTEVNDELCTSIPGPHFDECGGPGGGARVSGGEGVIRVHNGIHGVGNLAEPLRDWRNPIARIRIERIQ